MNKLLLIGLILMLVLTPPCCSAWSQYRMDRKFATNDQRSDDRLTSINNLGDSVVLSGSTWDTLDSYVVKSDGSRLTLPRAPGFWAIIDGQLSDQGLVAGTSIGANFSIHSTAMLFRPAAGTEALDNFEYWNSNYTYQATALNNLGTVVGYTNWYDAGDIGGACAWGLPGQFDGYLPGVNDSGDSEAMDVNDAGAIVGMSANDKACRWVPGAGLQLLPMQAGCSFGYASSINASGWMAGKAIRDVHTGVAASYLQVWNPAGELVYSIQTGTSQQNTRPNLDKQVFINDAGDVAFYDTTPTPVVRLWNSTNGFHDINSLVTNMPSGYTFDTLVGFNNRGQLIGQTFKPGVGRYYNVLLIPVPEPGTLAVLALGAVGLLKRRKVSSSD